jgi:uncharacterized protein (TIGR02452 family)
MSHNSIKSFEEWVDHSRQLSFTEKKTLKESFTTMNSGGHWDVFEHAIHAMVHNNTKLVFRVTQEAWNANQFPRVGHFYKWLNGNGNISQDRRKAISKVVRDVLFTSHTAPISSDQICREVASALHKKDFKKGWEGNIHYVVDQLKGMVSSAPTPAAPAAASPDARGPALSKSDLAHVFQETQKAAEHGYRSSLGTHVMIAPASVDEMKRGTHVFRDCPRYAGVNGTFVTEYSVVNRDSLRAAKDYIDQGERPLVLNLANARSPGGGVRGGSKAQEEDMMRCSNYSVALFPELNRTLAGQLASGKKGPKYRIPETGAILTPQVTVFRDGSNGYAFLDKPFEVDMLASAAYDLKPKHWGGPQGSCGPDGKKSKARYGFEEGTKAKIRTQLTVAANTGHTCLVLGAFGCGAFENKPEDIARWYKESLNSEFRGVFKKVTFAVLAGKGPASHNFDVFSGVFPARSHSAPGMTSKPSSAPSASSSAAPQAPEDHSKGQRLADEVKALRSTLDGLLNNEGAPEEIERIIQLLDQKEQLS